MTWTDLAPPPTAAGATTKAVVTVRAGKMGRNGPLRLTLTVRTRLLEKPPFWFAQGAGVKVQIGHGEHAGMIRITPGRGYVVQERGQGIKSPGVRLPIPAHIKESHPATRCKFDYGDDWIEVTLPGWACAPSPPPAAPKSPPYVGIMQRAAQSAPPKVPLKPNVRSDVSSVATALEPQVLGPLDGAVEATLDTIEEWADANGVDLPHGEVRTGNDLGIVNKARAVSGLPRFRFARRAAA